MGNDATSSQKHAACAAAAGIAAAGWCYWSRERRRLLCALEASQEAQHRAEQLRKEERIGRIRAEKRIRDSAPKALSSVIKS